MIRIRVKDIETIKTWYIDAVLPIIMKSTIDDCPTNDFEKTIFKSLNDIDFCSDILSLPISEIVFKYEWVKYYKETIDKIGKLSKKRSSERDKSLKEKIDRLNDIIKKRFDYNLSLGKYDIRAQLIRKLNIKVCPYCNRQFINPVTYEEGISYLGDIDHLLPKSKYSLFQLSFYNLIPACKVCNQLFKRNKVTDLLIPYDEGFGDDAFLKINYSSVREMIGMDEPTEYYWYIASSRNNKRKDDTKNLEEIESQFQDKRIRIRNNIKTFKLNEVYKADSIEFKKILRIKYINESQAYRDKVDNILNQGKIRQIERIDDKLLYGVSLDEERFQDEILSKAIYDIVINN